MQTNNKIYRLLPMQIPLFWDAIKYACIKADMIKTDEYSGYFNELLQALLSDKAQCFVVLDESKILHTIAITRLIVNRTQLTKELDIQCMYSMTAMKDAEISNYFSVISDFAKQEDCKRVTFNGNNWRIWQIAEILGCVERYRSFIFEIGGN